jgi:hypothetical protein
VAEFQWPIALNLILDYDFCVKRLIISISIGIFLTLVLGLAGGFFGGACHCLIPMSLLFPYGTIIVMHTSWEALGFAIAAIQFPLYSTVVANLLKTRRGALTLVLLLTVHIVATLVALGVVF